MEVVAKFVISYVTVSSLAYNIYISEQRGESGVWLRQSGFTEVDSRFSNCLLFIECYSCLDAYFTKLSLIL